MGKVYLVGAGPGAVEHLTVQAYRLLQAAEVVVYDALANGTVLSLLPSGCERYEVGKRGGQPSPSQEEINQLLVTLCQQGRQVIRLKSGDPFIFGRALAEIQALQAAHCDYEVVPGLSTALVAPLLVGIPLTDPVLGHQFAVLTGHDLEQQNWEALAQLDTLVVLMGGRALPQICQRLLAYHKSAETPVAVIRWAGQPQQTLWEGTLLTMPQLTRGQSLSPCIIVIGQVAALRPYVVGA